MKFRFRKKKFLYIHLISLYIHITSLYIHLTSLYIHITLLYIHMTSLYSLDITVYSLDIIVYPYYITVYPYYITVYSYGIWEIFLKSFFIHMYGVWIKEKFIDRQVLVLHAVLLLFLKRIRPFHHENPALLGFYIHEVWVITTNNERLIQLSSVILSLGHLRLLSPKMYG